jgi:hypothetical protein
VTVHDPHLPSTPMMPRAAFMVLNTTARARIDKSIEMPRTYDDSIRRLTSSRILTSQKIMRSFYSYIQRKRTDENK